MNYRALLFGVISILIGALFFVYTNDSARVGDLQHDAVVSRDEEDQSLPDVSGEGTSDTDEDTPQPIDLDGAVLDMSGKGLTKVSRSVFDNVDVVHLNLSHNALTGALPAEIRLMKNLKVLNMSYNSLTGVPAEVGQLQNLEVLDLSHNPITGLPYEIGNLTHLRVLDLSHTNYSHDDLTVILQSLPTSVEVITE